LNIRFQFTRYVITVVRPFSPRLYQTLLRLTLASAGVHFTGVPRYLAPDVRWDLHDLSRMTLGDDCVVSTGVLFLVHDYSVSRALKACGHHIPHEVAIEGDIVVGDNAFVGARAVILPGCVIGENAIVGAGSVVKGHIPPGCVVAGCPARPIQSVEEYLARQCQRYPWLLELDRDIPQEHTYQE
jgi:acetyltransferase-like isoleucine patch superfamily enzyme